MELKSKVVPIDAPQSVRGNPLVLVSFAEPITIEEVGFELPSHPPVEQKKLSILDVGISISLMLVLLALTLLRKKEPPCFAVK